MNRTEIKQMRRKQLIITNILLSTMLLIYFFVIYFTGLSFTQLFIVIGSILVLQVTYDLLKRGKSTHSLIPFFNQVVAYEKEKMGREWNKQRKWGNVWNLLLGGFMFLQAYWFKDDSAGTMDIDVGFMLIFILFILGVVNISLLIHFRKIDYAKTEVDMLGYTWKSNLISIVVGLVLSVVLFMIIIAYVLSGISG